MRIRTKQDRLRELDEAATVFKVAGRAAVNRQGWLRAVRRGVGIPVAEAAGRIGLLRTALYRMEVAEGTGAIKLKTLRRAAAALGCELVYGLTPKKGTLADMAAAIEAAGEQRRARAYTLKLQKGKAQRLELAEQLWGENEEERRHMEFREYWEMRDLDSLEGKRPRDVWPADEVPFSEELKRRTLRAALRKKGIRLR